MSNDACPSLLDTLGFLKFPDIPNLNIEKSIQPKLDDINNFINTQESSSVNSENFTIPPPESSESSQPAETIQPSETLENISSEATPSEVISEAVPSEEPVQSQSLFSMLSPQETPAEVQSSEVQSSEVQSSEVQSSEAEVSEAPSTEESTSEAEVSEAPSSEESTSEVSEAPSLEESTSEAEVSEAPSSEEESTSEESNDVFYDASSEEGDVNTEDLLKTNIPKQGGRGKKSKKW